MRGAETPGGMLSPPFEALETDRNRSGDWENSYELEPRYDEEGVSALGEMFGEEVATDGGYVEGESSYRDTLADVDHESPVDGHSNSFRRG